MLDGAPYWQHRDFILKNLTRKIRIIPSVLTMGFLLLGSYMLPFLPTPVFPSWNLKRWSSGLCRLPCMLLLCVCWWKWCDVDPRMLLLLLELVELLSGLGVAIVVLDSGSSAQAAMQSETSPSLPPDGTLRHLNAAAAPEPRLWRCCLQVQSKI